MANTHDALTEDPATNPGPTLTTYYNGACPVCRTEIRHYEKVATARGSKNLVWRDIATDDAALAELGLDREAAKRRLHVIDRDGRLHTGIDAMIAVWRSVPGYGWLATIVSLPLMHGCAARVYDHLVAPALYGWNRRNGR
jgi:predicted DCC family thiol-disulfide oxidoreductase YuxK